MIQKLYTDAVIPSSSFQYLPSLWLNIFIYFHIYYSLFIIYTEYIHLFHLFIDSVNIILNDTKYFFTDSGIKF